MVLIWGSLHEGGQGYVKLKSAAARTSDINGAGISSNLRILQGHARVHARRELPRQRWAAPGPDPAPTIPV